MESAAVQAYKATSYHESNAIIEVLPLNTPESSDSLCLGVLMEYASWNSVAKCQQVSSLLKECAKASMDGLDCNLFFISAQVDSTEESLSHFIGDDGFEKRNQTVQSLPCVSVVMLNNENEGAVKIRVDDLSSTTIMTGNQTILERAVRKTIDKMAGSYHIGVPASVAEKPLRIFIAGDRSSVGKSSVCLGMIGSLLRKGYQPEDLAYIKPATQSESTQMIQLFCEKHCISCVPIGPIVYYRGFTRAFLAGETLASHELLDQAGKAVDRVSRGKKVVLVDGVGFPAVGSICGTDNASVLKACGYPVSGTEREPMGVVLIGGSGVGAAVDAFNLNATYFSNASVPVLGAIFNKLAPDGFYSLDQCREQVSMYFNTNEIQQQLGRKAFGFLPVYDGFGRSDALKNVDSFFELFESNVDVEAILTSAERVKANKVDIAVTSNGEIPESKRQKLENHHPPLRSRKDIESNAINAGAAPSA